MQYLSKKAFDQGFKDFKQGNIYDSPFELGSVYHKEWLRGIEYAYNLYLHRNKSREQYRENLDGNI